MFMGAVWMAEQAGAEASPWTMAIILIASVQIAYIKNMSRGIEMDVKMEKIAELSAENTMLKAFANELLANFPLFNSIDGEAAQALAVRHGLMIAQEVSQPCHGGDPDFYCACDEAGLFDQTSSGKVTCYKTSSILRSGV